MPTNTTLYLLGWAVASLAVLQAVPVIVALDAEEWRVAGNFATSFVLCAFVGGGLIAGFRGRRPHLNRAGTIAFAVLIWGLLPFLAAIPLVLTGYFETYAAVIFEATSGLTTTGASVLLVVEDAPAGILVWRAVLQWWGGVITLLTAMLVLAPLGISGAPSQVTIPGYERGDIPRSVLTMARVIIPIYGLLTLVCVLLLWILGVPAFEALCLGLSAISTGGFEVRSGGIGAYGSAAVEMVLAIFMIVGATSILSHRAYLQGFGIGHMDNKETVRLIVIALSCGLIITILTAFGTVTAQSGTASLAEMARVGFFRAISLITTTGFDNAQGAGIPVPFVIALMLCCVGGASFSTAGGLKQFRFLLLMADTRRELARLVHPHAVTPGRIAGRIVDRAVMRSTWALFAALIIAIAVFAMILAVRDLSFENALIAAVSALTNNGPALGMAASPEDAWLDYSNMSPGSLIILSVAMVLGRIELLIVLCMFNPSFWEK